MTNASSPISAAISPAASPFRSFWQAGFECADHINNRGQRVDLLRMTGHEAHAEANYRRLAPFGIRTVREGIRWGLVERRPHFYDFTEVGARMAAGRATSVQQLWDICHFGFPSDLSPLHPRFESRFAEVCAAFTRFYRSQTDEPLIVTPINEVSFLSWLGGDVAGTVPFARGMGFEVKRRLAGAFIAGIDAIRTLDPSARLLTTEPLIHVVAPTGGNRRAQRHNARMAREADGLNESQFQSLDMLCGRMCPELGGRPEYLDLLGFNFYYNNQWEHCRSRLPWEATPRDPRWRPLHELLHRAWQRYGRPVVLSETSHPGTDRPRWLAETAAECRLALDKGVPLLGVCLYPIIDRPDWDDLTTWHRAGLWDAELPVLPDALAPVQTLHEPSATALRAAQLVLPEPVPAKLEPAVEAAAETMVAAQPAPASADVPARPHRTRALSMEISVEM